MKRLLIAFVMISVSIFCMAPGVNADFITWTDQQYINGTGFGNVTNVLSLQAKETESGSVIPTNNNTGSATNTSKTWTSAQLAGLGFNDSNLAIVWNVNQEGHTLLSLLRFSLDFYNGSSELQGQAFYTSGTKTTGAVGTGTSGWLLAYTNTGLLTNFFAHPDWVLGGTGSAGDMNGSSNDGQDNFYLVRTDVPPPPVSEPMSLLLLGLGLIGTAGVRRFRK